jgi:hypothetical protein
VSGTEHHGNVFQISFKQHIAILSLGSLLLEHISLHTLTATVSRISVAVIRFVWSPAVLPSTQGAQQLTSFGRWNHACHTVCTPVYDIILCQTEIQRSASRSASVQAYHSAEGFAQRCTNSTVMLCFKCPRCITASHW